MIVVHLSGGLGNQMFQYAAGRALALRRGVDLRFDVRSFKKYKLHHGYQLDLVFNCKGSIASSIDISRALGWRAVLPIRYTFFMASVYLFRSKNLMVESDFSYLAAYEDAPRKCYLFGYWQSEKYFSELAALIRNDFVFKRPLSGENATVASAISSLNSISMHVRRGDYIKNQATLAKHGLCSLEYYQNAIDRIIQLVKEPAFFIFSDDIEWVKRNIVIDYPCKFIDQNSGADSFFDMSLMSMCKHHIIANSSFGWWGAWLASSPEQIVIAPEPWFDDATIDSGDLLPDRWIKLAKN